MFIEEHLVEESMLNKSLSLLLLAFSNYPLTQDLKFAFFTTTDEACVVAGYLA